MTLDNAIVTSVSQYLLPSLPLLLCCVHLQLSLQVTHHQFHQAQSNRHLHPPCTHTQHAPSTHTTACWDSLQDFAERVVTPAHTHTHTHTHMHVFVCMYVSNAQCVCVCVTFTSRGAAVNGDAYVCDSLVSGGDAVAQELAEGQRADFSLIRTKEVGLRRNKEDLTHTHTHTHTWLRHHSLSTHTHTHTHTHIHGCGTTR